MESTHTDRWTVAWAHSALATVDLEDGDLDGSASHAAIATDMFLERGDLRGSGWGLVSAAHAAFGRGNLDGAEELAREALDASTRTMDHRNVSWVLELLAEIATERDDNEHAALLWGAAHPFLRQRGLTSSASKRDELKAVEATLRNRLGSSFKESFTTGSEDPDSVISQELAHSRAIPQP